MLMNKEIRKQREKVIDSFLARLRDNMVNAIELEVKEQRGTKQVYGSITELGESYYNGTATFTIKINGGARDN